MTFRKSKGLEHDPEAGDFPVTTIDTQRDLIARSGYFDAQWYSRTYRDVARSGMDPLDHFLRFGHLMRRNPSPLFDARFYLETYGDAVGTAENPLIDYLLQGRKAGRKAWAHQGKVALIVHVFHLDVLDDLAAHAANMPEGADRFVTCPDTFGPDDLARISKAFAGAQIVQVPNAGQDVGALVALSRQVDLSQYDVICKAHTKKGAKEPVRWRQTLLRGILGSPAQVQTILCEFQSNPRLVLAGAEQLFLHGPTYIWKNGETLPRLFSGLIRDFDHLHEDWGFIGGTCFWIRGTALGQVLDALEGVEFVPAAYSDDGTLAHSVERMFGMMAAVSGGHVLLCDASRPGRTRLLEKGFPEDGSRTLVPIPDVLRGIDLAPLPEPRGSINHVSSPVLMGWLAVVGDPSPREALLRVEGHEVRVEASLFRGDLKDAGINEGRHAFSVPVPPLLCDGKPHEIVLIDAMSGHEVARRTQHWDSTKRSYHDFQGFLKSSMTQPMIHAPFVEEDKRAFAVMEGIANRLVRRALEGSDPPLVSIVMPMFNRATVVGEAIMSVLAQVYDRFELIVVDDGSTDDSVAVVATFDDPRIRLIQMPENAGVTVARNTALRAAGGSIIAYLDSDNTWDPRFVAAHVGALAELPEAQVVYSGVLLYNGTAKVPHAVRYGHYHRALLENQNYIDNNVIVHRRSLLDRIGGFDESLRRFVDYDLILRAAECARVVSVPVLLCHYFYGKADNAITSDKRHVGHMQVVRDNLAARQTEALNRMEESDLTRPVTVVIPNWQSLEDIRDCLAALCRRDWKGMLDILVVDNHSSPDVQAFLQAEQAAGRIGFIKLGRNFGFTHAVNVGIAQARAGSDIILLNNDAIARPGAVQALQRACLDNPEAGMTVPRQILPVGTPTIQTHVPYASLLNDCDVNISAHHQNVAQVPLFHDGEALELTYAAFFAVYIRREVIDAIGPLDAEYGRHYRSDRVQCDMMRNLTGYRLYYTPQSHFIHKLQRATNHLRDVGKTDNSFDLMFRRNRWEPETAAQLGFRFAPWDE